MMRSRDELAMLACWQFDDTYRHAARRKKCSRADFRSGWDAAWLVIAHWLGAAEKDEESQGVQQRSA